MSNEKQILLDNTKLWDEILKAIVDAMPEQLLTLFQEVYGKYYPIGTTITLLSTESSTYQEKPGVPPTSRMSDIALLVNGTDYYHLECQMRNDNDMVIRMIAYDLHFAMQYTTYNDDESNGMVMRFPHSAVIYPAPNNSIPKALRCRIIFQDNSEHIYQIPTVRIQSYSLQEIHEKHLTLFIPYVLLRLRPKLDPRRKYPLTKRELTDFVDEVMMILKEELVQGYLTGREFEDYINLFRDAADKIFEKHTDFQKEVDHMTKPLIELPSRLRAEIDVLRADNDVLKADIDTLVAELAEKAAELTQRESELTRKESELAKKESELTGKDEQLAEKNAELSRMRELLSQYQIPLVV